MCDTKFSIYLYSVRFGIRSLVCGYSGRLSVSYAMQSLGFSVKQVFKEAFGNSSFSRRVTSTASVYFSLWLMVLFYSIRNCPNIAVSSTSSDRPPTRG